MNDYYSVGRESGCPPLNHYGLFSIIRINKMILIMITTIVWSFVLKVKYKR